MVAVKGDTKNVSNSSPKKSRAKIVSYLIKSSPAPIGPKMLAIYTELPYCVVKKQLRRILAEPKSPIVQVHRGWYRGKIQEEFLAALPLEKKLGLHGIKFEGKCPQRNSPYSLVRAAKRQYRKRGTYYEFFGERKVTVTVHAMGLVEVFISTTSKQMDFMEFDRFISWMRGLLSFVDDGTWRLRLFGMAVDIKGLRIEGAESISLKAFRNAWARAYQKGRDTLRVEAHATVDITVPEIYDWLSRFTGTRGQEQPYQAPAEDRGDFAYR
jgi:hypothetical protein